MDIAHIISFAIDASLFLIGFGVGLETRRPATTFAYRHVRLLVRSFVSMNVIMPMAAIATAALFALHPAVEVALVTLAVSPLPIHFPHRVAKASGDDEFAVSLLVTMALISIIVVPASLWSIGRLVALPLAIAPFTVFRIVASDVLIPVGVGALVRSRIPAVSERIVVTVTRLGTALLVIAVIPLIIRALPSMIALMGDGSVLAIALFALVGLAIGHVLGGANESHRAVLAVATASRHPAVALAIARANFADQKLAPAAILLDVLVSAAVLVLYFRRRRTAPASTGASLALNAEHNPSPCEPAASQAPPPSGPVDMDEQPMGLP